MFKLLTLSVAALAALFMSGCKEQKTSYLYLMTHPDYLQQVYNQCVQEAAPSYLPCEIVMQAQADFTALVNQREKDAERFGAQVLQAEADSIFIKNKFQAAWKAYDSVDKNNTNIEEIKKMRLDVDKTRDEYKESSNKVKILLQVIAASTTI